MNKTLFFFVLMSFSLLQAQCYEQIGLGDVSGTAKKTDGSLWSWGGSWWGQLGNMNFYNPTPLQIGTATDWDQLFVGEFNNFALKSDGTLWGIGSNAHGSLGINSSTTTHTTSFQQIGTATNWVQLNAARYTTYGLKSDGTLWGWGVTNSNELTGAYCCNDQVAPVQIGTDTDWVEVQASLTSSVIARKSDGTLWGWGDNCCEIVAQVSINNVAYPVQLNPDTDWTQYSVGSDRAVALKPDGTLWVWGSPYTNNPIPIQLGTATWKEAKAAQQLYAGIQTDGSLWVWGTNSGGELGNGITATFITNPIQVGTATDWEHIYIGGGGPATTVFFITKTDGSVWVWGDNEYTQYGNGTIANDFTTPTNLPVHCVTTLNTPTFATQKVSLYPNPATDFVEVSGVTEQMTYVLYDVLGKELQKGSLSPAENSMDISGFEKGVYLLRVDGHSFKVVKE